MGGGDDVSEDADKFKVILNFMRENGNNGVLLNKILVWVEIQSSMTAGDIWV